jgi:hypothetical protein
MDNQIVQPLRQYVVHIRSKDAEREGLLNSHLFIDLAEPININPITEEIHQIILSGEIPYSFYNISADALNNTIVYETNNTFTLPSKNYDIYELIDVITNDANFPFSATYDKYTMKITLTNTSNATKTINWNSSTANKVLGWSVNAGDDVVNAGNTTISPNVIDLATIHSLFIKSNASSNMVFSTRAGFSQTIQKVSVDVNSGNIIYLNQNDSRQHTILHNNINALDLRITDQNNNLINFNDINYEISIGFLVFPINQTINQRREINTKRTRGISVSADARNRPFTPSNIIRTNDDINVVDNEETDLEHQNKRKIIDAVLERMGKS